MSITKDLTKLETNVERNIMDQKGINESYTKLANELAKNIDVSEVNLEGKIKEEKVELTKLLAQSNIKHYIIHVILGILVTFSLLR